MIAVIPAFEPDEKLLGVVSSLCAETDYRIIVVNDGSSEKAASVFAALPEGVILLSHEVNRGKGRALKTAYAYIAEHFPADEGIVTLDADGQHLVKDVIRVSDAWRERPDALVLGSRRFTGKVPWKSRAGNAITRLVFRLSTGTAVFDTQTGLRAFSADRIPLMLSMAGERYEYEINVLLYATRKNLPILEVEIATVYIEENASSHFNPVRDAWRIYKMILLFAASSFAAAVVDYVLVLLFDFLFRPLRCGLFLSVVLARVISSLMNYCMNRKLVFEDRSKGSMLRYYLLALCIMGTNYALLYCIERVIPLAAAKLIVEILLYPVSFYMQRRFVFHDTGKERNFRA